MNLVPVPSVTYRCVDCGHEHTSLPVVEPCCEQDAPVEGTLTVEQISELAQVAASTVREWIGKGWLPAFHLGRVLRVRPVDWQTFWDERTRRSA